MIFVYNAVIVSISIADVFEFALAVWTLRIRGIDLEIALPFTGHPEFFEPI